jgi:muramidase (phage lysozyme)
VEQTALCIAHHESWTSGLWTAENPTSTASGAFQFVDGSWKAYSRSAGLSGYARASSAPPRVQAAVAAHVITDYGTYPWKGSGC